MVFNMSAREKTVVMNGNVVRVLLPPEKRISIEEAEKGIRKILLGK